MEVIEISFIQKTIKGAVAGLYDLVYLVVDTFTSAIKVINTDHYYIHSGIGYCLNNFTASLTHGSKVTYRFVSPELNFVHLKNIQLSSEGATIKATLKRDVTITGAGTLVNDAIANLNDNIVNPSGAKLYNGAVTYTGGVKWCAIVVHGSSTNQASSGGQFIQGDNLEYVTKNAETSYILEIENIDEDSDTAYNINLNMFFYEESRGSQ